MKKNKLLLIGWDAADWKVARPLMEAGKMPALKRLTESGTWGNLATIQPVLSPMLWTSIATGKRAWKHGIHGFSEPCPKTGNIRPISNRSRKTKAVWNIFNQEGLKSNVIGWWPSHPAEPINGVMISNHYQQAAKPLEENWPIRPGTVHPENLAEALKEFRVHPAELQNEHVLPFIPKAAEIDQLKDNSMGDCMKILAENAGIHAAATAVMQREPWDFMAVYYDGIDHFGHRFMRYHPPRLSWVNEEDFEKYKDVIEAAYRYHDMMLDVLLQIAGEDSTVMLISDHGFEPGNLRPQTTPNEPAGPAAEHSPLGIFCARGPGIKKNHEIRSACLLDIAPTLLHLKGLPIGQDMDGRVLIDIFETEPKVLSIPSWDAVKGEDGQHSDHEAEVDVAEAREEIKQLVELGYIDEPDEDVGVAIDHTLRELNYNLAQAYIDGAHLTEAIHILRKEWDRNPREGRFGTKLLHCYLSLRDPLFARETLDKLKERKAEAITLATAELKELKERLNQEKEAARKEAEDKGEAVKEYKPTRKDTQTMRRLRGQVNPNPESFAFLEGCVLHMENDPRGALETLEKCQKVQESLKPSLHNKIGACHYDLKNWDAAEAAYHQTLSIAPLDSVAHLGLAEIYTARKLPFEAAASALKSLEVNFNNPRAQFIYGKALKNLKKPQLAKRAFLNAVHQNPNYPLAWLELSKLHKKDSDKAKEYQEAADAAEKRLLQITRSIENADPDAEVAWAEFPDIIHKAEIPEAAQKSEAPLIVVSGLPRSGTSLMMQMLEAGGLNLVSDTIRAANDSNPKGYFEDERVKTLKSNADKSWLKEHRGEAIKIVMPLTDAIPTDLPQKIIFMERPAEEVVLSQRAMLKRDGKVGSTTENDRMSQIYAGYLKHFNSYAAEQDSISVLPIRYHDVLENPEAVARKVAEFAMQKADIKAMVAVVDPKLYRTQQKSSATA
ncbi:MAG: 2,3-bisphosphoglycerate-independent phosphoglycerate mutase [Opitutia bacterium UBA7350]|nr:MAG: 2,3-bisphosphoglycerate-independent phosphoglycerate mutase [Opitutae bacterium UBA7350]